MSKIVTAVYRAFDIIFSLIGLVVCTPLMVPIIILVTLDTGSPLFMQYRLGRNKKPFLMVKFRTMRVGTPYQVSHLSDRKNITLLGRFLRKFKLDEIAQLFNVLIGDISLVGPRPGLADHVELIEAREKHGVYGVRPGITGLSQINGVDMSSPNKLAEMDAEMIKSLSIRFYFYYLLLTLVGKGSGDQIK